MSNLKLPFFNLKQISLLISLVLLLCTPVLAEKQDKNFWEEMDEMAAILLDNAETDQKKEIVNQEMKEKLKKQLKLFSSSLNLSSKPKNISILSPEDSAFHLINWVIAWKDGSYDFEGGLQIKNKSSKSSFFFLESEQETKGKELEKLVLKDRKWVGAYFYELVEKKTDLQTYYTLIGWKGKSRLIKNKVIDVLWFAADGEPRFGAPIFLKENNIRSRIVFQFGAEHAMALSYEKEKDRIEFDALMPLREDLKGVYAYYFPDISFSKDAYYWNIERGVWEFQEAANLRTATPGEENKIEREKQKLIQKKTPIYQANPEPPNRQ